MSTPEICLDNNRLTLKTEITRMSLFAAVVGFGKKVLCVDVVFHLPKRAANRNQNYGHKNLNFQLVFYYRPSEQCKKSAESSDVITPLNVDS